MNYFKLPIRFEAIPYVKSKNKFRFLLIKRVLEDGGFWQPVTGTLESNESLIDCIYREMREEISVNKNEVLNLSDTFFSFTWQKNDTLIYEYVFGVELKDERVIILSDEHEDYRWCSFDEAMTLLEKDNNKAAYRVFKEKFISIK